MTADGTTVVAVVVAVCEVVVVDAVLAVSIYRWFIIFYD